MKLSLSHRLTAELQKLNRALSRSLGGKLRSSSSARSGQTLARKTWGRLVNRFNRSKPWLLTGLGLLLLWVWLWQWILSLAVGLAVTVGLYLAQQGQLRLPFKLPPSWQKLWSPANRSLTLASLAGLLALGGTYLATALWTSESHGLATGVILEGCGILAILGLLLWQKTGLRSAAPMSGADLSDLADADPLKRLIAVRQLTQSALSPVPILPADHLADCFRLMLDRETEPLVCSALLDGLQRLNQESSSPSRRPAKPTRQIQSSAQVAVSPDFLASSRAVRVNSHQE